MARLYFDGARSRLMEQDGWYSLGDVLDVRETERWCQLHGVEFFDHRIENYPECLRRELLRARAAARGLRLGFRRTRA